MTLMESTEDENKRKSASSKWLCSLEAVEPHPQKEAMKFWGFFVQFMLS